MFEEKEGFHSPMGSSSAAESPVNQAQAPTQPQTNSATDQKPPKPVVDEARANVLLNQIRDNQNLTMGILGGLIGAIAGATLWALFIALTYLQIGFMAVGVGFLVGYGIRFLGQGVDPIFGYLGAAFSLLGCAFGNLMTTCIFIAEQESIGFWDVFSRLDLTISFELMAATFMPLDILFYGLALYYGYKFSFRQLSEAELSSITKNA